MKKAELQSIIECVKNGEYTFNQHSYGAFTAGFITNYKIVITNNEHGEKFGRVVYWVLFSALGYGKVLTYGRSYNYSYREKYDYYDKKVLDIVSDGQKLSNYLH